MNHSLSDKIVISEINAHRVEQYNLTHKRSKVETNTTITL